jgi:hypothetical protein
MTHADELRRISVSARAVHVRDPLDEAQDPIHHGWIAKIKRVERAPNVITTNREEVANGDVTAPERGLLPHRSDTHGLECRRDVLIEVQHRSPEVRDGGDR